MSKERNQVTAQGADFDAFLVEFQSETDRAAAILAAAYVDDLLCKLLLASFVDNSETSTSLVKNEHPLGTFSSRISTSYAFGLITEDEHYDLDQLRVIRNRFAHKLIGLSFKTKLYGLSLTNNI